MRKLNEAEIEQFKVSLNTAAYKLLIEVINDRIKAYDELITKTVTGIDSLVMQQQYIGSKMALQEVLAMHKDEILNSNKQPTA